MKSSRILFLLWGLFLIFLSILFMFVTMSNKYYSDQYDFDRIIGISCLLFLGIKLSSRGIIIKKYEKFGRTLFSLLLISIIIVFLGSLTQPVLWFIIIYFGFIFLIIIEIVLTKIDKLTLILEIIFNASLTLWLVFIARELVTFTIY